MELDWQNKYQVQRDRLLHLFQNEKLTDCHFIIGDDQSFVPAHKLLLSVASPVFERMFFGSLAEEGNKPIVITDIQLEVFQTMLKYIYTDYIDIKTVDLACQLFYAAQKYLMKSLMTKCLNYLSKNINSSSACKIYEFTELFDVEPSLKQKCLEFIIAHTREVLVNPSFFEIKMTTLMVILDQDELNINSELDLFHALTSLSNNNELLKNEDMQNTKQKGNQNSSKVAETQNSKYFINEAIKKIRFLTMTPQEFALGPACSKLLEKHETLDILLKLTCPMNVDFLFPQGFCSSCRSRQITRCSFILCQMRCNENELYCQHHKNLGC